MRARDRLRPIATLIAVLFGVLMNVFPIGSQDVPVIAGAASVLAVLLGVVIAAVLVGRSRAAAAGRGEAGVG